MNNSLLFIFVLVSLFVFVAVAGAQTEAQTEVQTEALTEVSKWEIEPYNIILNPYSDIVAVQKSRGENYVLMDADGNQIADTGDSEIREVYGYPWFRVHDSSTGKGGIMNDKGEILLPLDYEWYDILSEKWIVGLIYSDGTEDNYDAKYNNYTGSGDIYLILEQADFYFEGNKAGSLGHDDIKGLGKAAGNYVSILNRSDEYVWYNSRLEKSPLESGSYYEYRLDREDKACYHQGSGQDAFTDGCTLNSDEVKDDYYYYGGAVFDLQGNLVFTTKHDYSEGSFHFINGYTVFSVSMEDYEVLVDEEGNEVIPPQYYDIEAENLESGYVLVTLKTEDNNRLIGWVKTNGEVSCEVKYDADGYYVRGNFLESRTRDDNGYKTIVSAEGEFTGKYKDFRGGLFSAVVVNENGEEGVVDLFENVVVPFSKDNDFIEMNNAGTVVAVKDPSDLYEIYHFSLAK